MFNGILSPVRNQGHCGSCWAFSVVGMLESMYIIHEGKSIQFSEQQILDCVDKNSKNARYMFRSSKCEGGYPTEALKFLQNSYIATRQNYPYKGMLGTF